MLNTNLLKWIQLFQVLEQLFKKIFKKVFEQASRWKLEFVPNERILNWHLSFRALNLTPKEMYFFMPNLTF